MISSGFQNRWNRFWFASYSPVTLALFRTAICSILLFDLVKSRIAEPVRRGFNGEFYFANLFYSPVFEFLTPPPFSIFVLLWGICFLFGTLALIGLFTRPSLFLAGAIFFYFNLLNRFFYHNHYYLHGMTLILFAFAAAVKTFSLRPPIISWSARLIQVTMSIVYLGSAASKTTLPWLSGDILQAFYEGDRISPPIWLAWTEHIPFGMQAWMALVTEYFLAFGLWGRKTRPWALVIGILFHAHMDLTMGIGSFSWQVFAIYLLFLDRHQAFAATPHSASEEASS